MDKDDQHISEDQLAKARRTAYLIAGYIRHSLTETEHDELDDWVSASDENMQLFEELTDEKNLTKTKEWIRGLKMKHTYEKIRQKMQSKPAKNIGTFRMIAVFLAAASLLWLAIVLFRKNKKEEQPDTGKIALNAKKDIPPGGDKAILILANGHRIALDSIQDGAIPIQEKIQISKKSAELDYSNTGNQFGHAMEYNELSTPRGGQYRVLLPDGSRVWLNAASTLRYPVSFRGSKERKVELTGEAYFEVAKNAALPFRVYAAGTVVEALGTHFNVNAYADENRIAATLLEGSVRVSFKEKNIVMKPGEQAEVKAGQLNPIPNINTNETIAWKNGFFSFHRMAIEPLMRQAARWYDVEIKYEGNVPDHFSADIKRDVPVSQLLHLLELTGRVHFEIKDKTIIVKP